ncbi:hypothetical protein L484_007492 [Morus notabilis]|uniref:Uncharacterized protein n=1 Tax=Morus notabilis TaxID=981085 RepID=W9S2L5_9ROSA|nr:hypothetical protein L484_007492 [Morus notabilis]
MREIGDKSNLKKAVAETGEETERLIKRKKAEWWRELQRRKSRVRERALELDIFEEDDDLRDVSSVLSPVFHASHRATLHESSQEHTFFLSRRLVLLRFSLSFSLSKIRAKLQISPSTGAEITSACAR